MDEKLKGKPGRKLALSHLTETDYEQISRWSGDGLSETQIATLLGVNISTITREKKRNEQFAHAIKKGRYKAIQNVANKVYQNAMDGKETSAIFFLKCRDPDNWNDKKLEVNHNFNIKDLLVNAQDRIIEGQSVEISNETVQFLEKNSALVEKEQENE